jgi:hypothetical protein
LYNAAMSGGLVFPAERRASDHRHQTRDDKQDEGELEPINRRCKNVAARTNNIASG